MAAKFDIGDVIRLLALFETIDPDDPDERIAVDPTTITLRLLNPSGDELDGDVEQDSVGHYHADVVLTEAGRWRWRWEATGDSQAAEEGHFRVRISQFP